MGPPEEEQVRVLEGRYRLGSVIGQGGMGVVWRARDLLLNRDVAVKEIVWPPHLDDAEREAARRGAFGEAQMAARLAHPNVVGIYDIITEDDRPWIVMELFPYPSLRDIVRDDGPLTPGEAARVGLGVLAALGAAHAEGVLHRDVKPANVLVGPDGRVVLTDFGIARAADAATVTASGTVVGSPPYISPERARGGQAGPPGDMWGLGVTLYAAVEGRPPFERDDPISTLTAVVAEDPEPASRAGPLWPVISGLLRKDPDERLDAAAAGRMLRGVAGGGAFSIEPVVSPPMPVPPSPEPAVPEPTMRLPEPDSPPTGQAGVSPEPLTARSDPGFSSGLGPSPSPPTPARDLAGGARPAGGAGRLRLWPSVAVALAVAVVAIGVALGIGVLLASGSPRSGAAASPTSAARPAAPSPSASPSAASPSPASSPASGRQAKKGGGGRDGLPGGFYRYADPTGFSIGVPRDWRISHSGHDVYLTDPDRAGVFLLIDQSDQPKPDPLADWRQQQANRAGTYPDYRLIRLDAVRYPQAEKAADWEFTYDRDGVRTRVLNRNVLASARHAYALYWSTPAKNWSDLYHYFKIFASTFHPAM